MRFLISLLLAFVVANSFAAPIPLQSFETLPQRESEVPAGKTGMIKIKTERRSSKIFINGEYVGVGDVVLSLDTGLTLFEESANDSIINREKVDLEYGQEYSINLGRRIRFVPNIGYGTVVSKNQHGKNFVYTFPEISLGFIAAKKWWHELQYNIDVLGLDSFGWLDELNGNDTTMTFFMSGWYNLKRVIHYSEKLQVWGGLKLGIGGGFRTDYFATDSVEARVYEYPDYDTFKENFDNGIYELQTVGVDRREFQGFGNLFGFSGTVIYGDKKFRGLFEYAILGGYNYTGKAESFHDRWTGYRLFVLQEDGSYDYLKYRYDSDNTFSIGSTFKLALLICF